MNKLAPHETLELHELIGTSSAEIKSIASILTNTKDDDLKKYLQDYQNFKRSNLQEMQKLIDTINQ